MNLNKLICTLILRAQMWSDAAKGIESTLIGSEEAVWNYSKWYCYQRKDYCITSAINLIDKNKRCDIKYYISYDSTINSALIYFKIHMEGKTFQISFHSFNGILKKRIGSGMPMRWKGIAGSSRSAAEELQCIINK